MDDRERRERGRRRVRASRQRSRRPGLVSWLTLGSSTCSDPRKTELLLEHARAGHQGAREELRWLYRPRLIRILRARVPASWGEPRRVRDLAEEVLDRGLRSLDSFEYTGTASLWPHLRSVARRILLRLYRGEAAVTASRTTEPPVGGGALARELEQDALERYLFLAAGRRARKAVLLRIDLGLELEEVAAECRYESAEAARKAIEGTLFAALSAMSWHTTERLQRHALIGLISAVVEEGSSSAIPRLLAHPRLQETRRTWVEESSWLSLPAMLGFRLSNLVGAGPR